MKKQLFLFLLCSMSFTIAGMYKLSWLMSEIPEAKDLFNCYSHYMLHKDKSSFFSVIPKDSVNLLFNYCLTEEEINKVYRVNGLRSQYTLLSYSIFRKIPLLWDFLLKLNKINVNIANDDGETPLIIATKNSNTELCRTLLPKCDRINSLKPSPLAIALKNMNIELIKLYIQNGCNVNADESPLYVAAMYVVTNPISLNDNEKQQKTTEIVQLLIGLGANIETAIKKAEEEYRSYLEDPRFSYVCSSLEDPRFSRCFRTLKDVLEGNSTYHSHFYYPTNYIDTSVEVIKKWIRESEDNKNNTIKFLKECQKRVPIENTIKRIVEEKNAALKAKERKVQLKQERLAQLEQQQKENERRVAALKALKHENLATDACNMM